MRLAIIVSHPIQYYSPWFRHIAAAMGCVAGDEWRVASASEAGDRRSEAGDRRSEAGDRRPEAGGRRSETRGRRSNGGAPNPQPATRNSPQNALRVFYLWDFGVTEKTDKGFGQTVRWDVDLLAGYDHEFVPNVSRRPGTDWFGGLDNPELLQRVKAFDPDVVLQFGYNYKALLGFDLKWNTKRAPLMFRGDSHLLAEGSEQGGQCSVFSVQWGRIKRWVRRRAVRLLFRRFACFLAVGKANADYFRAHGVPDSKIVRCPHVVDNAFFAARKVTGSESRVASGVGASSHSPVGSLQPRGESRGLRAELGIAEDELVFLFAGKLEKKKQPMQLLEAFFAADIERATLLFVGSGELESALKERAGEGGGGISVKQCFGKAPDTKKTKDRKTEPPAAEFPAKRVLFLAFQNQTRMPDVYRTGDVLVLPSRGRYETWGLAVNEAACCGQPAIVSSHVGCGKDLIEDGVTGWIFEAGDGYSLRSVLETAAAAKDHLRQMGENLRKLVLSEYSYKRATTAFLEAAACATKKGRACTRARPQ